MKDSLINAKLKIGNNVIPVGKTFSIHMESGTATIDFPDNSSEPGISKRIQLKAAVKDIEIIIEKE